MISTGILARPIVASLALAGVLSVVGCSGTDPFGTSQRQPIQPAPAGLPNSGIGAPGGASEDTRSIGTMAASEGEATGGAPSANLGTTSIPIR
jgi:hypothetical protein